MNLLNLILFAIFVHCMGCKGHSNQHDEKKQYVNFGDGEYENSFTRGSFGGFDSDGMQGMFGGGGGGGGGSDGGDGNDPPGGGEFGGGGMQLNENNFGGLNLQNNELQSFSSLIGPSNQIGGNLDGLGSMFGGGGGMSQFAASPDQSSFEGKDESLFGDALENNNGNDNLLSPFGSNSMEGNLEKSVNLGDTMDTPGIMNTPGTMNTPGIGQVDMNSFDQFDKASSKSKGHLNGDDTQGTDNNENMLSNELGLLDSTDEKLQKMLESGFNGDSGLMSTQDGNTANSLNPSLNPMLSSQSQMDQMDSQPSNAPDEQPNGFSDNTDDKCLQQPDLPQCALNQLSGAMTGNNVGTIQTGTTIHAHVTDKQGSDSKSTASSAKQQQLAQQINQASQQEHKGKLKKLKEHLTALKKKLATLEEEQAKKSTNGQSNNPKVARHDAIKKLLIKNLKLAAMIASKEIQVEELKGKDLGFMSRKKEDGALLENSSFLKTEQSSINSKPLTELSKKAEEEVNHLSKNPDLDKKSNSTLNASSSNSLHKNTDLPSEGSSKFLTRINETLQVLDKASPEVHSRSLLTDTSRKFLKKLHNQIQSMTAPAAQVVEEKALATLYDAIKAKGMNAAKRKVIQRNRSGAKDSERNVK